MAILRFGQKSTVQLDVNGSAESDGLGVPRGHALADVAKATAEALASPLNYPPLSQCTTPGDRVVLALDRAMPQAGRLVAAAVQVLIEAGIDPDGITILQDASDLAAGADPCEFIPAEFRDRLTVVVHDPTDRRELAYLAANEEGGAILVNRTLHEADFVLPIGCLRGEDTAGYFGIHGAIYPSFSDIKTQERFRGLASLNGHGRRRRELVADADHVAWLLGIMFTLQVVPAGSGKIMHVLAGESESIRQHGQELYRAAWGCELSRQANLVVAAIEGDAVEQTWENLGRALAAAGRFVEEDGAIAVCCDLAVPPGPAVQRLAAESPRDAALRHVNKERPPDALVAGQIARILDRNKVYLLSRLDPAFVEELEIAPVADPDELSRLVHHHSSCLLLGNAPYVTGAGAGGIRD